MEGRLFCFVFPRAQKRTTMPPGRQQPPLKTPPPSLSSFSRVTSQVEDGECGELWVSGPSVAAGYWNKPEVSEKAFRAVLSTGKDRPWAK